VAHLIPEDAMTKAQAEATKIIAGVIRRRGWASLIAVSVFGSIPASAQNAGFNHLDCWFDEAAKAVQCTPISELQTGRASRIDRAFEAVDTPASSVQAPSSRAQASKPRVRSEPKPRPVRVAREYPKNPSCTRYKTYDAATKSYRGYDGVVKKCR
jgi:hypothetical protein